MIDELAQGIGQAVIGAAFLIGIIFVASRVTAIFVLLYAAFLLGWAALVTIGPLLVIFALYIPKSQYGAAIATVLVCIPLVYLWAKIGLPALLSLLGIKKEKKGNPLFKRW